MANMSKEVEEGKAAAALAYIVAGIIWFFVDENMKKNNFAKYHVKQGIVLVIVTIAYNIALSILFAILFMPFAFVGGFGIFWILHLLYYVPLVFVVMGILNAINGREKPLPWIGKFADKFKI